MTRISALRAQLVLALSLAFAGFEIYTVGFGILSPFAQRATMLAFASILVFLTRPLNSWVDRDDMRPARRGLFAACDLILIVLALFACSYLIVNEDALADRSGIENELDLAVAAIGPLVLLEMVRRIAGYALFLVAVSVVIYGYGGDPVIVLIAAGLVVWIVYLTAGIKPAATITAIIIAALLIPDIRALLDPALYPFQGLTHDRLAPYLWLTSDGTFGSIAAIMTEFIFIFILFAGLLEATGAGATLINLAVALTGRFRGGPAQSAVVASSLFGMVSGSTIANVVSTGTLTIPLMIRTGFSRVFAGAVESVASCGGQIVPPIMGAGVFLMAEITGVPYVNLMGYALIPAVLYFASLAFSIYFETCRLGLKPLSADLVPKAAQEMRKAGYLLIPVGVLLFSIIAGETPGRAGFKAVIVLVVMIDLVRSMTAIDRRWGKHGIRLAMAVLFSCLVLAYGPTLLPFHFTSLVTEPLIGEMSAMRIILALNAFMIALTPAWRALPIMFPLALATARWDTPQEFASLSGFPAAEYLVPLLLTALAFWLIILAVREQPDAAPSDPTGAKVFGQNLVAGVKRGVDNALGLVAATYVIGLIVGILVLAAAGVRISFLVTQAASASLFLALVFVMLASLVLGMGLPTVAAYLLLVVVVAPAISELGISIVAAHMFIFYFGVISSITPPVALAAFAASGISGGSALKTAFTACKLAITAFIVPFLFVYYPELLLLEGSYMDALFRLAVIAAGLLFVAMAAMGYATAPLGPVMRTVLLVAAACLFAPVWWANLVGIAIGIAVVVYHLRSAEIVPSDS